MSDLRNAVRRTAVDYTSSRRDAEMGECLGLHIVINAVVRESGSLQTYS